MAIVIPSCVVQARGAPANSEAVIHVRPAPSVGFVEVPDTGAPDELISIEPADAPPRLATAVRPVPPRARPAVIAAAPAPKVVAAAAPPTAIRVEARERPQPRPLLNPMIDGQAPPLTVLISFPKARPHARIQADALAQTLRGLGVAVDEAAVSLVATHTPRIGYVFAPDRPAALAISVNAGAQYGFVDPVSIPFSAVPEARPGLIEIMLPG